MKKETILTTFIKYTGLNVIAMIGLSCYILADTFFIANGIGVDGLAALNLAIPMYSVINGAGLMIGIGGATKYSIFKAQKNYGKGNEVFTHALILGIILGILFLFTGLLCSGGLSEILGSNDATYQYTNTYLKTIMAFAPMFIVNNILVAFIRNDGNPNLAMMAMLSGSISNIILDYIFIYPFKMGMFGAAFATGIAPVVSIILLSGYFIRKRNGFNLIKCKAQAVYLKIIVELGTASFITELSSGIVIIVFNIVILRLKGNMGVAAYGIVANLALVATSIFTGIAQGIQPIISTNYGCGNKHNMKKVFRYAVITSVILAAAVYLVIGFSSIGAASLFNRENNPELTNLAAGGMRIYFIGFFFAGLNIIFASWFSSIEKPVYSFGISILRGAVIIIPVLLLMSSLKGLNGVWMTYPVAEFFTLLVGLGIFWFTRGSALVLDKSAEVE